MRLRVALGCSSVLLALAASGCQFDHEEAARNRRAWVMERDHILDPVAHHAQDVPVEGLDPTGPRPLFGPRRDPDIQPRAQRPRESDEDRALDALEQIQRERALEEK
jgi:hypothetical protein